MKILKVLLFIVLGLVLLVLVAALFVDKEFNVKRSIVINKPNAVVFEKLKSLKTQDEWSVWGKLDPNMKKEFVGTDGTVGCISKWSGNDDVGEGEQEIKKIVEGERIENELRFLKPFKATNMAIFTTEPVDSASTTVNWELTGSMPYPMNIMKVVMNMDESVGNDFANGLSNLKALLEKQ